MPTGSGGMFWERHPKGRYEHSKAKIPLPSKTERIREGLRELKKEIQIWKDEVIDAAYMDPIMTSPLPGTQFNIDVADHPYFYSKEVIFQTDKKSDLLVHFLID